MIPTGIWPCLLERVDSLRLFHVLALVCKESAAAARLTRNNVARRLSSIERTHCGWQEFLPLPAHLLHGTFGQHIRGTTTFKVSYFRFGQVDVSREQVILDLQTDPAPRWIACGVSMIARAFAFKTTYRAVYRTVKKTG